MAAFVNVTLSCPAEIEGDWEYCWFDETHQHFLLLNDSYFYLLPCANVTSAPTLFAHIRDLPQNLLCGRVSIDKKIIAIQNSLSSIIVVDVSSKKKWVVEIRYPSDNAILSRGILWSDHGGNSEDLIIVTNKGMELYKISQVRSQCKMSRVISQPVSAFWYNPCHRMIMLAAHAQPKYGYNRNPQSVFFTPIERPKEMLLIDGFYLNCEKSSIPMLELPPPDRVPRLELGPGLGTEDVSLVSLYGKVLCLVRYVEHGMDFITIYHMGKTKTERTHCLMLNCPTNGLLYSTYDNLLICHCIGERVSLVFDIASSPARSKDGVSSTGRTLPLGRATAMHFLHKHRGGAPVSASGSARNSATDRTVSHEGRRPSGVLARGSHSALDGDARSKSRDALTADWGPLVTPQKRNSRIGPQMMFGKKDSDITNFETLTFSGELSSTSGDRSASPTPYPDASGGGGDGNQYTVLAAPESAQEVYSTYAYEYLAPNRLLDAHRRVVWEIKCSYQGIVREMSGPEVDPKEVPLMLSRRGQRYTKLKQAAEGVLDFGQITLDGRAAKQLMLSEMLHVLVQKTDPTSLKAYFRGLMRSYGSEYRRVILAQYEALHAADQPASSTVASPVSGSAGSTSIFSMTAAARRRLVAESLFGAPRRTASTAGPSGNMGVYPGLQTTSNGGSSPLPGASSEGEVPNFPDSDPLEVSGTTQLLLPDISMVGVRARKQHYCRQQLLNGSGGQATGAAKIKPTCQAVVLHTRRDIFGCLICTQAEILSHVWLPLLLNTDVDYEYCALALSVFVAHLRESNVSIAPAVSALLLNVLFHSHRYVEVGRLLQQRELPDSLDLALYALEFCDMLQDHLDNLAGQLSIGGSRAASPPPSHSTQPLTRSASSEQLVQAAAGEGPLSLVDDVLRHRTALVNMRQAALDVLQRLDERTTIVKWHLSHGRILDAIAVCKKRNGQWQAPLTPGSIPGSEFFTAAVSAAGQVLKPLDAEVLRQAAAGEGISPKEVRRLEDRRAAAAARVTNIFYALFHFLKEWDGVLLLPATNATRSRLASQVSFPEHLFEEKTQEVFKKLFGFS